MAACGLTMKSVFQILVIPDDSPLLRPPASGACPISRLAPETLIEILALCLFDVRPLEFCGKMSDEWEQRFDANAFVASMMLVCRHWRRIILGAATLWSRMMVSERTPPDRLPPHLERSCRAPVTIFLYECRRDILPVLNAHLWRTKELHLWFYNDINSDVLTALSAPAPVLCNLSVYAWNESVDAVALPPMFSGHAPSLRQLHLSPYCLRPLDRFAGLTHLRLANQADNPAWTISVLLDTLEAMPNLELLDMFAVLMGPLPVDDPKRLVVLPKLRLCNITYHDWDVVSLLLSHIEIPERARLIMEEFMGGHGDSIGMAFPADVSHLKNMSRITKIQLRHLHHTINLAGFSEDGESSFLYDACLSGWKFDAPTLRSLSRFLNVRNLTEVWVDISPGRGIKGPKKLNTVELWTSVFAEMRNLRLVSVSKRFSGAIIKALTPKVSVTSATSMYAPNLETLIIYNDVDISAGLLQTLARRRHALGHPLHHLHVAMRPYIDALTALLRLRGVYIAQVCVVSGARFQDQPRMSIATSDNEHGSIQRYNRGRRVLSSPGDCGWDNDDDVLCVDMKNPDGL